MVQHKSVPGTAALLQQLINQGIFRIIEIQDNVRIVTDRKGEVCRCNGFAQFSCHPWRHIGMISLFRLRPTDIVIPCHRDKWQALQLRLETIHHIIQHFLMDFGIPAIALDQVAQLKHHPRIRINQLGRPFE